jgi:hypothetical protein
MRIGLTGAMKWLGEAEFTSFDIILCLRLEGVMP